MTSGRKLSEIKELLFYLAYVDFYILSLFFYFEIGINDILVLWIYFIYLVYTGLTSKDKTSETIVQTLYCLFPYT